MKRAVVCGAGGFIGSHLVKALKRTGRYVRGVDLHPPEYSQSEADEFCIADLREARLAELALEGMDEVYQLAADMGGAGFVFTGYHDLDIMTNSAAININIARAAIKQKIKKLFFSSSACVYPAGNPAEPGWPARSEDCAYPATPDSEYGWEKLFAERIYLTVQRVYGVQVRIARFHNIYGPEGTWYGGREKAPAALARKIAMAHDGDEIEIWGSGTQARSFTHISDCIGGVLRLMESEVAQPINVGSDQLVTINALAQIIANIAGKHVRLKHVPGPEGVIGRNSDNRLILRWLGWQPSIRIERGMVDTYAWIEQQVLATPQGKKTAS